MGLTLTDTILVQHVHCFINFMLSYQIAYTWIMSDKPKKAILDYRGRFFHTANKNFFEFLFWNWEERIIKMK